MKSNLSRVEQMLSPLAIEQETARFMSQVYILMSLGVALTAFMSTTLASFPQMVWYLIDHPKVFIGLLVAEIGLVAFLSAAIQRISSSTATFVFFLYSALNGITLSLVFSLYVPASIFQMFMLTAFAFAGLSSVGYLTKKDLGFVGSFCLMALFALVGYSLAALVFPGLLASSTSQVTYSALGVLIFAGLTAYDTQKIKALQLSVDDGEGVIRKQAIHGALTLYLDFINLFFHLLRLMGRRR